MKKLPRLSEKAATAKALRVQGNTVRFSTAHASGEHLEKLNGIERAAASAYPKDILSEPLRSACVPFNELSQAMEEKRLFVALPEKKKHIVVGYALAANRDDMALLVQMDVHPDYQRRGAGRALLERVCGWAGENGYISLWLTTFNNIPCNRPFYEKAGFMVAKATALPLFIQDILEKETRAGLRDRVAMCRMIPEGKLVGTADAG